MSALHRLLRQPFFGRFEEPWVWPDGTDPTTWERVAFHNPSGATLRGLWGPAHAALRASQVVWPSAERNLRPEREAARVIGRPSVLLVYGDADIYTPPAHGQRLLTAFRDVAHASLSVFPSVGHTYASRDAAGPYTNVVLPFLRQLYRS